MDKQNNTEIKGDRVADDDYVTERMAYLKPQNKQTLEVRQ